MSRILGVFSAGRRPLAPEQLQAMLSRLQGTDGEPVLLRRPGAILASVGPAALHSAAAGPTQVARPSAVHTEDGISVAADASLYYRAELLEKLTAMGVRRPPDAGVAELILAAYRAWGPCCPEHLEGDFAFVICDEVAGRVLCARDFAGRKPLVYAEAGGDLVVASSLGAVLQHPHCPTDLDPTSLGAAAAGLFAAHTETVYRAVSSLPPGHTLLQEGGLLRLVRHWQPPRVEGRPRVRGVNLEEGAEHLRTLLLRAVAERLDPERPTAVWMSGGWDSTSVFGAGMAVREAAGGGRLLPVSISYPPDDPGHEDEYIRAVAERWMADVHWLDIRDIPFFDRPLQRAAERDEPFGHVYEMWNRALAVRTRQAGARVALEGVGGDQLFQVSFVYLADLLRRGRLLSLAREWRVMGLRGRRSFLHWAVLPALPGATRRLLARRFGPGVERSYLDRSVPDWIRADFVARHGVLERERRNNPLRGRMPAVAFETHWYLIHPFGGRILSTVASFAQQEGVELRSPLYDGRIVEFAASRPWTERSWRGETKRLLRHAVKEWLPASVLAPRLRRTGLTSGFFEQSFRIRHADFVTEMFRAPVLADAGIVDAEQLSDSWSRYRRHGGENLGIALYFTLQTEMWLRARIGSGSR